MKIPKNVMFFSNGNVIVFDGQSQQVSPLQSPWFLAFIDKLKDYGLRDDEIEAIEFTMPNGRKAKYIAEYDNWQID